MAKYRVRKSEEHGLIYEKMPKSIPYYLEFKGVNGEAKTGEVIITEDRLKVLADKLMQVQEFAYDTETNTLRVQHQGEMKLAGISISWGEHDTYYIPVYHKFDSYTLPLDIIVKYLRPCFKREDVRIIGQNLKYDLHVLANVDMEIETKDIFDTMVARWLTDENEEKGLKEMTSAIYNIPQTHFDECLETVTKFERKKLGLGTKKYIPFQYVRLKNGAPYALADAYWTWRHYVDWQLELLEKEDMQAIFKKGSMPFLLTLYKMERRGARVDLSKLQSMAVQAKKDLEDLEYKILELAGTYPFEVSSSQQVAELLFGYKKYNKENSYTGNKHLVDASFNFKAVDYTKTGIPQTGDDQLKDVLKRYANTKDVRKKEGLELIVHLRKHKRLSKLNNAFITGLIEQAYSDGKVHPTFNQCGCLTAETLIPTEQGLFPIGELANLGSDGEFVEKELTITNRFREPELTKYVVKYLNRETIKVETVLGYTLEGTYNHPIIKNKFTSTELTNNLNSCRTKELYRGAEEWARLDELTEENYIALPYGHNTFSTSRLTLNYDDYCNTRAKKIKLPRILDEDVAEFIGIYQADGSIHDSNGTFSIRITNGSPDVINRVSYLSKKLFGIEAQVYREVDRNSFSTVITGLNLKVIEKTFELRRRDVMKEVPKCILQSPKEVIVAYIRGLTLDSCVVMEEKKTYLKFTFSNNITAKYIQEILLNLGIVSTRRQDKSKSENVYHVLVYNSDYIKFKEIIGFIEKNKVVPCSKNIKHNYRIDEESKTIWLKVRNITKSRDNVYDFNVPKTHSFISGAFISHNTDSGRISCSSPNLQQLPRPIEINDPVEFNDWYKEQYGEEPSKNIIDSWAKVKKALVIYKDYPTGEVNREICSIRVEGIEEYLKYLKDWFKKNEENVYWKYYEIRSCFIADSDDDYLIALD